jgi:hypothetical protein
VPAGATVTPRGLTTEPSDCTIEPAGIAARILVEIAPRVVVGVTDDAATKVPAAVTIAPARVFLAAFAGETVTPAGLTIEPSDCTVEPAGILAIILVEMRPRVVVAAIPTADSIIPDAVMIVLGIGSGIVPAGATV